MPQPRKVDRRIQRTRALLRTALMQLIVDDDKPYDAITIQDITDQANVARTTFYLHFTDKDDLLFSTMRDIYEELFLQDAAIGYQSIEDLRGVTPDNCEATDFEHVEQYADFYRIMLGERGSAAFLSRVRDYLAVSISETMIKNLLPPDKEPIVPIEVIAYAIAGAHIGVIKWWLDADMPVSAKHISYQLYSILTPGLLLGLNADTDAIIDLLKITQPSV